MKELYAICGLYYVAKEYKGKEVSYGVQRFLGVEGEYRLYIYDKELTDRSLIFETKKEAKEYMKAHNLDKPCACTEAHFIVTITEW